VPAPAPATFELLAGVPVFGVDVGRETVTPTGAAILATLADAFGPLPPMRIDATGLGAGSVSVDGRPNVVRVLLGTAIQTSPADDQVVVLEANVDDMTPELVPDVLLACLEAGAIDAWAQPIHMKKGRPGLLLAVLARPEDERTLAEVLLRHATTLGVRVQPATRHVADRATREVVVDGHVVRVKLGMLHGQVINIAPEHDDCSVVADATDRPVKQIWAEALAAAVSAARAEAGEAANALPR
jgi:pyridinium-3,5-bisthiocarboxylic acid mononucleotide nickel chelatase